MDSFKTCTTCKTSKSCTDYIGLSNECFKCTYKKKLLMPAKKEPVTRECKICQTALDMKRWKYCSDDCAKISKRKSRHWTQTLNTNKHSFRKFNFKQTPHCTRDYMTSLQDDV